MWINQYDPEKKLWEVRVTYHDYTGKKKQKHKKGFATKREAKAWGEEFILQQSRTLDMTFGSFYEEYRNDMINRLRENTVRSKDYIIELKILPFFKDRKMAEITPADIRRWQNDLMKQEYVTKGGQKKKYSQTYLKTVNNQLAAIFNYAVKYFNLTKNPCHIAGSIGKNNAEEMEFWTREEFEDFLEFVKDKPVSRYAFETLFWTGLRIGELLALNLEDFNYETKTLRINKSFQRIKRKDVITAPKTEKGVRIIALPDFLAEELKEYTGMLYGYGPKDRFFNITKSYLEHEMIRGVELSGVKKIRLHDLRHSHASFLISEMGADPLLVANRLGHEKIQTTLNTYSHLYPNQNRDLADKMDKMFNGDDDEDIEEEE